MNPKALGYWIPTGLFTLALAGSGAVDLVRPPDVLAAVEHLGFPAWFPVWLGAWKLAGVIVLLVPGLPRLKEWATAGFTISLSSASAAHFMAGDPLSDVLLPLALLGLGLVSWALRPESRRLPASRG